MSETLRNVSIHTFTCDYRKGPLCNSHFSPTFENFKLIDSASALMKLRVAIFLRFQVFFNPKFRMESDNKTFQMNPMEKIILIFLYLIFSRECYDIKKQRLWACHAQKSN